MPSQDILKFSQHDLTTRCYSASNVRIVYAGTLHTPCGAKIAREKTPEDDKKYPGGASGSYPAFASPVQVEWQSQDGSLHSHVLNLDEIFKDKIVLHKEEPARIYKPMPIVGNEPRIIIEVNNRTLNVYMFVTILVLPPNLDLNKRTGIDNRTLVYSKTF